MELNGMNYVVLGILALVLLICTYTDLKERKIYNVVTLTAIAVVFVIRFFHHPQGYVMYIWGIVPAILLYLLAVATKGKAIGGGDILLVFFLGLTIGGVGTMMTLAYALILSAIVAGILFVVANKKITKVPMAPFLALGVVAFYTQQHWLVPIMY